MLPGMASQRSEDGMATKIRDVMTPDPVVMPATASARDAAAKMREQDIGDVLVEDDGTLRGIVTDRDLVVRVMAADQDPSAVTLGECCSGDLHTVTPDDDASEAVRMVREHAVRRIPVTEGDNAVGIVAMGDLAVQFDRDSALADVSAAPGNS
jgi:CBS domain-containing protein